MNKKLIAGNWKMNGSLADNEALVRALVAGLATAGGCDAAVAVPAPYLAQVQALVHAFIFYFSIIFKLYL